VCNKIAGRVNQSKGVDITEESVEELESQKEDAKREIRKALDSDNYTHVRRMAKKIEQINSKLETGYETGEKTQTFGKKLGYCVGSFWKGLTEGFTGGKE